MVNVYDKIRLKSGTVGRILEELDDDSYIAEIFLDNGDVDTTEIKKSDIQSIFEEVERPLGGELMAGSQREILRERLSA